MNVARETQTRSRATVTTPRDEYVVEKLPRRRRISQLAWLVPVIFGLVWLADAYLKWQPGFQQHFMDFIRSGGSGQPGWLSPWYHFWEGLFAPIAGFAVYAVAAAETLIAIFLIFGFARKITYIAGALYSFGIWAIPEGFGNDDRAMSMDIGTSAVYVLVFLGLWAIDAHTGPRRFSLDALIEKRFPTWKSVAEVRSS